MKHRYSNKTNSIVQRITLKAQVKREKEFLLWRWGDTPVEVVSQRAIRKYIALSCRTMTTVIGEKMTGREKGVQDEKRGTQPSMLAIERPGQAEELSLVGRWIHLSENNRKQSYWSHGISITILNNSGSEHYSKLKNPAVFCWKQTLPLESLISYAEPIGIFEKVWFRQTRVLRLFLSIILLARGVPNHYGEGS